MGVLRNAKHEKFCQAVAYGLSPRAAYIKVFGKCKSPDSLSSRLSKQVKVFDRLKELQGEIAGKVIAAKVEQTVTDLRNREARIAELVDVNRKIRKTWEANAARYAEVIDKDGKKHRIPGGDQGIVVPVSAAGGRIDWRLDTGSIREHRAGLQQIAQESGDWTEKVIHSGGITVKRLIGVSLGEF